ncbi:MAG TPA: response regulator [Chryseosolibacter sp.]|nr:response regulator [Chryseosolibacter sp.]
MREEDEILLIEDDEDKASVIKSILRKHLSGQIRHFEDGEAALAYLLSEESNAVRLILLDVILPKVDGVEILRTIKSHPLKSQIPVIILTSSSRTEEYIESLGLHPDGYVHKPNLRNCA